MTPRAVAITASTVLGMVLGTPTAAQTVTVDLPAGTVRTQVLAIGRLAQVSVTVPDQRIWARRVPALRGRMNAATALRTIASRSGARLEILGPTTFRLSATPTQIRPLPQRRPPPPRAAPEMEEQPAEIVVTASKRDLTQNQIAGQTTRIDGRNLEFGGSGGTDRLAARISTIASTHLGAGRNKLFIRGIADSSFTGPTQATVGQYFGDLRLSYNAPDPDLRLADLEAVEVLAGPQGTLYGAGSLGGLIRLVPNRVDLDRTSGSVIAGASATTHGAPGWDMQGVLNLPVIEGKLGIRVVATAVEEGGYIDKPAMGRNDVNRTRIQGGRATAHLDLGSGWSAELIGIGQRIRGADSQYVDRDAKSLTRLAPVTEGFEADFLQGQFVVNGSVDGVHIRSSTGVTSHDLTERYDATVPGGPPSLFAQANHTRMIANESRAWRTARDGSGWLVGLSYTSNRTSLRRFHGPPRDLTPLPGVSNSVEEMTLYGETSTRVTPRLLLTGGLRVTRSVLKGAAEDVPPQTSPEALAIIARRTEVNLLPSASALFDLTAQSALFIRFQQGFRPGGLSADSAYVRRFNSDRVTTLEAGYRFGRASRDPFAFSLTVAHTDWNDIQADFLDETGLPITDNIGNGRLWTMEAAFTASLARGLRLDGALSLNDSNIDELGAAALLASNPASPGEPGPPVGARLGPIPNIARVTGRVGMVYETRWHDRFDLKVDGWTRYVGPSRLGIGPVLGDEQGSYFDSGVTARLGLAGLGVTAGVTNITNTRGNRFSLGTPFITGRQQVTPLRPRTFRVGVDLAF